MSKVKPHKHLGTPTYRMITPWGELHTHRSDQSEGFVFPKLVHGSEVIEVEQLTPTQILTQEADGLIIPYSRARRYAYGVTTADCLPIILGGREKYAVLHAGWKGVQAQIYGHELVKEIRPRWAIVGPAIQQRHYQVGPEFRDYFDSAFLTEREGKLLFDLPGQAQHHLKQVFGKIEIFVSTLSTFSEPRLGSFRRDGIVKRNYNIFIPNED